VADRPAVVATVTPVAEPPKPQAATPQAARVS
jgi:hypothetical protein